MTKPNQRQKPLVHRLLHDQITDRKVCEPCFNGHHDKCEKGLCNCMHHESVKRAPRKKSGAAQETMEGFGTIRV